MDRNQKFLSKLTPKELAVIQKTLANLLAGSKVPNVKKLVGHANVYRVRMQRVRIIFIKTTDDIEVLEISRRNEKTYKKF